MNPGFVMDILSTCSGRLFFNSSEIDLQISIGGLLRSRASNKAIFEERSPKSLFFGGARENSFSGKDNDLNACDMTLISFNLIALIIDFF